MARSSPQRKTPIRGQTKSGFRESRHYPRGLIGTAKQRKALDTAKYMGTLPKHQAIAKRVHGCGDYLLFRHFFTIDAVKLHAASFCMKHLLCPSLRHQERRKGPGGIPG